METRAPQGFIPLASTAEPRVRQGSAPTDLPKPKTVSQVEKPSEANPPRGNDAQEEERRAVERAVSFQLMSETEVKTHEATGSIVIQTRDAKTGEILSQFPNNATLKQRAMERYAAVQGAPTIKRLA